MAWSTPKEDWAQDDVVAASDFNRIESNIAYLGPDLLSFAAVVKGFTADQNITVYYGIKTPVDSAIPKIVTMVLPYLNSTSNATSMYLESALSAGLRPKENISIPITVIDGAGVTLKSGEIKILLNGEVWFTINYSDSAFNNSTDKGFPAFVIQYPIWP